LSKGLSMVYVAALCVLSFSRWRVTWSI